MPEPYRVMRNKQGFTLLETIIAVTILTVMMFGSLKALMEMYEIASNNILRDQAVRLADEILTDYRNIPYDDSLLDIGVDAQYPKNYQRQVNNANVVYTATVTVATAVTNVAKSVQVQITWNVKNKPYSYTTSTVVGNK